MRPLACALVPVMASLAACGPSGSGGSVQFTASGEVLALGGYSFPPSVADEPAFVDGWELEFERLIVTIARVNLSEDPDLAPTDQSRAGKKVAELEGPWAIDLHQGGPLTGKGGSDEQAVALATLDKQNLNGDEPFDATRRYAFGFDLVPASASATRVNLDAADADYAEMIAQGYTVLYVGTATWKGTSCTSSNAAFDFMRLPKTVAFRFGFKTPTTYVNCQNPDNDPAEPLGDEEHQRGLQVKSNAATVAQVTVHSDHPFWESVVHDAPPHFDHLAALAVADGAGKHTVTSADLVGADYTALRLGGDALPWRSCLGEYTPPDSAPQMHFDAGTIPHVPNGDPTTALRDLFDFMTYAQSTQGHLNADGLCFVERHYPSPN
jgi:hypothetical protein